jgi:hypothetical protein
MKRLLWIWPAVVVILIVAIPWGCYRLRAPRPLDIVVLDKTVPFENRLEHRSLFWLLNHLKIVRPDGEAYDRDRDYLGAFPGPVPGDPPQRIMDLAAERVHGADLLYIADTYGVYEQDLVSGEEMKAALERSPKIYGGLQAGDVDAVEAALDAGTPVVAEFNSLGSPTGEESRRRMERILGVRWTRWIGRFFAELSDEQEVPQWMRNNYEREWERPWRFSGPGYVLLQDDAHCEVLRVGHESKQVGLTIDRARPADRLLVGAADGVAYPYWFDVVEVADEAEVLARFHWRLTPEGLARLTARGLPRQFPAVVRYGHPQAATLYFAGDFSDNPMADKRVPFAGYLTFKRRLESVKLSPSESSFYWTFYVPVMNNLLSDL